MLWIIVSIVGIAHRRSASTTPHAAITFTDQSPQVVVGHGRHAVSCIGLCDEAAEGVVGIAPLSHVGVIHFRLAPRVVIDDLGFIITLGERGQSSQNVIGIAHIVYNLLIRFGIGFYSHCIPPDILNLKGVVSAGIFHFRH